MLDTGQPRPLSEAEESPLRTASPLRSSPPLMRIRLKLLLLLLAIGLVPLLAVTWFDLGAARRLGLDLSNRAREVLEERAKEQMLASVRASAKLLRQETKLLETASRLQAQAVARALAAPLPAEGATTLESTEDGGILIRPGQRSKVAARLNALVPTLVELRQEYAPVALWQRLFLEDGTAAAYPASARALAGERPDWYQRVRNSHDLVLVPPHPGPVSGLPIIAVAAPVLGPRGEFLGAAAFEAPVGGLLGTASDGRPAHVLVIDPTGDAAAGSSMRIAAERRGERIEARDEQVRAADAPGLEKVLADMVAGRPGVHRVRYRGEDTLWAYAAVDGFDTHLAFVQPYREVVADAEAAQDYVAATLDKQRTVLLLGLLVFVPLLIALAVFSSRAVTKPLGQLAKAARRIAAGDFAAHTTIHSGDELEELGALFNAMVPQLRASIRMGESLALAQEVQRNLLPHRPPRIPGVDIAGLSVYCDETGGDYYDFLPLPELGPDKVAVMIGDVAGHGISAALLMTTARALLRSRPLHPGKLARMVGEVNTQLCSDSHAGRFMTLFVAVLDAGDKTIHWVGAGHDPGLIYDPSGDSVAQIGGLDIPLGVDAEWRYHELFHAGWSPGTVLLLGTDGISETRGPSGEMFGRDRVIALVREHAAKSAAAIADAVIAALAAFRGTGPQRDDVTLVVVKAVGD